MVETLRNHKKGKISLDTQERKSIELSTFYSYEEVLTRTKLLKEDIPVLLEGEENRITQASDTDLAEKYLELSEALERLREIDATGRGPVLTPEFQELVVMQPGQRTPVNSSR
jgi:hypothetical protein